MRERILVMVMLKSFNCINVGPSVLFNVINFRRAPPKPKRSIAAAAAAPAAAPRQVTCTIYNPQVVGGIVLSLCSMHLVNTNIYIY